MWKTPGSEPQSESDAAFNPIGAEPTIGEARFRPDIIANFVRSMSRGTENAFSSMLTNKFKKRIMFEIFKQKNVQKNIPDTLDLPTGSDMILISNTTILYTPKIIIQQ